MKCPQCNYARRPDDKSALDVCPRCGVIYSKFDPAVRQQREALREVAARRNQFHNRMHSHWVNVMESARAWADRYGWLGRLVLYLVIGAWLAAAALLVWSIVMAILGAMLLPSPKVVNVLLGGS